MTSRERVEKSKKLLKLQVEDGHGTLGCWIALSIGSPVKMGRQLDIDDENPTRSQAI